MYCIKESSIDGRGLFAAQLIPAGAIIGKVSGTPTMEDGRHVIWLSDEIGLRVENDLRFVNHASEPNAAFYSDGALVALRDITPGEEITHDYVCDGDAVG